MSWNLEKMIRGRMLDKLDEDRVFYVEKGEGGFLLIDSYTDTFFSQLSPLELIELGSEFIKAGTEALVPWTDDLKQRGS